MKKNDDHLIEEKLRKLPKINDDTPKDQLYLRVSSQLVKKERPKSHKRKSLIPIFGTLFVCMIVLLMVPTLMDHQFLQSSNNDTIVTERSTSKEIESKMERAQEKKLTAVEESTDMDDDSIHYKEGQYVIQSLDADSTIIHAAVADEQLQYVIPLSFVVPKTDDLNFYFNNLDEFFIESEWGISDYMFENVMFEINESSEEVVMELPDDYSLGEGEARAHIFEKSLSMMFTPYGIDKVVFNSYDNEGIDLGPIGVVNEMPLLSSEPSSYKLYQVDDKKGFLVPIFQEARNISAALENMKENEEDFNVYRTIPSEIDFKVDTNEDLLLITFDNRPDIAHDDVQTMIEAVLMTAKSYGYNSVLFENSPFEQIGPYDMSNPIEVPEAVNPLTQVN